MIVGGQGIKTLWEEQINIHFLLEDIEFISLFVDAHVFPWLSRYIDFFELVAHGCQLWPL
jgi:hypothetical protein